MIEVYDICEEKYSIEKCPSLSRVKVVYQMNEGVIEQLCYVNQRRPHGPQSYQQGMQGSPHAYYNPNQTTSFPSLGPPRHSS